MTSEETGPNVPDLTFRHYDARQARDARDTVALIHRDAYADAIASGDPFASHDAFMRRFDAHTTRLSLDLVISYVGDEPVGQAWGWPEGTADANQQTDAPDDGGRESADEGGSRTFGFAEIMVRAAWTGRGIAHALHDELLGARPEQRAELYVRPSNTRAYQAYLRWGWRKVGEIRPDLPDAPLFDVLILLLPIGR